MFDGLIFHVHGEIVISQCVHASITTFHGESHLNVSICASLLLNPIVVHPLNQAEKTMADLFRVMDSPAVRSRLLQGAAAAG